MTYNSLFNRNKNSYAKTSNKRYTHSPSPSHRRSPSSSPPTRSSSKEGCKNGVCSTNTPSENQWSRDPRKWGPYLWTYMHYAAANYPEQPTEQEIHDMMNWLCTLHVTIPCTNCQVHYKRYIDQYKPYLYRICANKHHLFNFLVDIHNQVNKRNNKPIVSYEQAREMYYNDVYRR